MHIKFTVFFTGKILKIVACLFFFPAIIALVYGEYFNLLAFLPLGVGLFIIGFLCSRKPPKESNFTAAEGFLIVALSWLLISLAVAFSFFISGEIKGFINCFFEAVSGLTTTGATVVSDVESLSYSVNALRLCTHWVGGMGILVLVLAVVPKNLNATSMNIFKAEVPGHQVDKFTEKVTATAKILYLIYTGLTVVLAISFMIAKMPVYDSIVHAMSIAGTGGFSVKNAGLAAYGSDAIEGIATVFMFLFGTNLNIFYLIIIGKFTTAIKSEELRTYVILVVFSILFMATCLTLDGHYDNFGTSLKYASFETTAIVSTTGMYLIDFSEWSGLCQAVILLLMFTGGCSGSTSGGIKISRLIITGKYIKVQCGRTVRPNRIKPIKLEGESLDESTVAATLSYLGIYFVVIMASFFFVAIFEEIFPGNEECAVIEKLTAVISAIGNIGPAFGSLAAGVYKDFSVVSKLILCFDMLAGRLEILPMLFLFNPKAWRGR